MGWDGSRDRPMATVVLLLQGWELHSFLLCRMVFLQELWHVTHLRLLSHSGRSHIPTHNCSSIHSSHNWEQAGEHGKYVSYPQGCSSSQTQRQLAIPWPKEGSSQDGLRGFDSHSVQAHQSQYTHLVWQNGNAVFTHVLLKISLLFHSVAQLNLLMELMTPVVLHELSSLFFFFSPAVCILNCIFITLKSSTNLIDATKNLLKPIKDVTVYSKHNSYY